jgi:hypothetical protein
MLKGMIFFYALIVCCLGFTLIWIIYYFWKRVNPSDHEYHTSVKLPQNGEKERRKYPRADVNWRVPMETSDGTIGAEVKNISLGGALIRCEKPLPLAQVFRLTMIGRDNEPVIATAEVVWSNVNLPKGKVINRGMGVRFVKMSDKHIHLVRQIVPKE